MKIKNLLAGVVATGALALGSQAAQAGSSAWAANTDDDAGTYLGSYNPTTFDLRNVHQFGRGHRRGSEHAFEDFWVFDLDPGGAGSISARSSRPFTAIVGFHGRACMRTRRHAPARAAIARRMQQLGFALQRSQPTRMADRRWEIDCQQPGRPADISPRHGHDVIDGLDQRRTLASWPSSSRSRARLPCWDLASSVSA